MATENAKVSIPELKAKREPILEKRELNRAKGDKMNPKVEESCNAKLVELNLAIQADQEEGPLA